jgi:PEP-CTERM motif
MKKIILTILGCASLLTGYSQGTVTFANLGAGGLNSPILMNDGTTKISGTSWIIELMGGATAANMSVIATDNTATTALLAPGYFNGGAATVAGISAGGAAAVQVLIYSSAYASFAAAQGAGLANLWGMSGVLNLAATGNPNASPPGTPVALLGLVNGTTGTTLGGSNIILNPASVPEPTTLALGALGGLALMAFRRRKS